jgi:hypothetical protein
MRTFRRAFVFDAEAGTGPADATVVAGVEFEAPPPMEDTSGISFTSGANARPHRSHTLNVLDF